MWYSQCNNFLSKLLSISKLIPIRITTNVGINILFIAETKRTVSRAQCRWRQPSVVAYVGAKVRGAGPDLEAAASQEAPASRLKMGAWSVFLKTPRMTGEHWWTILILINSLQSMIFDIHYSSQIAIWFKYVFRVFVTLIHRLDMKHHQTCHTHLLVSVVWPHFGDEWFCYMHRSATVLYPIACERASNILQQSPGSLTRGNISPLLHSKQWNNA